MELILVSGTRSLIDTCLVDLHIQLDRFPHLPRPFSVNPWNKTKMSPLRDRLMIEWMFSQREATKELYNSVKAINDKLLAKKSKGNTALMVGLSCSDGTCLSPCFVEKLYDYFNAFPPLDNFRVVRNHLYDYHSHHPNDIYWEHLPFGSKFFQRHNELETIQQVKLLTKSRDWCAIPPLLNSSIEEAYLKNPFSCSIKINDVQIDFVSGTLYNKTTGQKSYIRCSHYNKSHIDVKEISHEVYKQYCRSYEAAGILPYTIHPVTGEAIFLVGKLTYDGGSWSDFGGLKSRHIFRESPAQTAARECYEETMGVIGSSDHLLTSLRNYSENNVFKIINENSRYVGHFLRIPFGHYLSFFATLVIESYGNGKDVEVKEMRWIPLSAVRIANRSTMSGSRVIEAYTINEIDGSVDTVLTINLRIEFAYSLCIAEMFGVLDSIEHIAKRLHPKKSTSDNTEDIQTITEDLAKVALEGASSRSTSELRHQLGKHKLSEDQCQPIEPSLKDQPSKHFYSKSKQKSQVQIRSYGMAAGRFVESEV